MVNRAIRIVAIIQARMGSTRLPGKVLGTIGDRPLIQHAIDRARAAKTLDQILLATTTSEADDPLVRYVEAEGIPVFRGSENDVLGRFVAAASACEADIIVRITGDDPFKDPALIDSAVEALVRERLDFIANNNPPTFPEGLDVEVIMGDALATAAEEATLADDREHVTEFHYRHKERFAQRNITCPVGDFSQLRLTVDRAEDVQMAEALLAYFEGHPPQQRPFGYRDVIEAYGRLPTLFDLNAHVGRSSQYRETQEG